MFFGFTAATKKKQRTISAFIRNKAPFLPLQTNGNKVHEVQRDMIIITAIKLSTGDNAKKK